MATFKVEPSGYKKITIEGKTITVVKKDIFDSFNEDILGLGKIETKSTQVNALSVMFDLEGFTNFCKQIDPHLAVPEYLGEFLKWIFDEIKNQLTDKIYDDGYKTWSDLPFLSKYLGDGVLFLWNTEQMSDVKIQNVVVSMYEICKNYLVEFIPKISKNISSPPTKLRCGIARGTIYSVGNGNDFVGPCINMSARLQKLNTLTFCFSRRGINPSKMAPGYSKTFIVKKVDIRGIGSEELVCFSKREFDLLPESEKSNFKNI
jgi:hypothetical protein